MGLYEAMTMNPSELVNRLLIKDRFIYTRLLIFMIIRHPIYYGISIGGQKVSNLRYADDTALCGKDHEEICNLLDAINERGKEKNMKLNAKKTKVMHIGKGLYQNVAIDGVILERVEDFIYLG